MHALKMSDLNELIQHAIEVDNKIVIANHNLHSIYLYHFDEKMRAFYELADYVHIDGVPLILWGRLTGLPLQQEHRVTYVDWIGPLAALAAKNQWRIFYLGSKPGVAHRGAQTLCERYPGLCIETEQGYFDMSRDSDDSQRVLAKISAYQPHIVILGMGMPRQESWGLDHMKLISANVVLNGGAAIDYVAGAVPTPPRWASRLCLEWGFRLFAEPGRLWRRYLLEPWAIVGRLVAQRIADARK